MIEAARCIDETGDIVRTFNELFCDRYGTVLEGGADEPLYLPAAEGGQARILFKLDYPASALHEAAHWCLAGERRRQLKDYGYWYVADRGRAEQTRFECAEVAPQALEWIFAVASGRDFRVSADYFLPDHDVTAFRRAIQRAAQMRVACGLPYRARIFADALAWRSGADYLSPSNYMELPT